MKEDIKTMRLENGLTVITEKMPDVRSATIGFWFRRGSRHEPAELNGICHFIEHAVFKGTGRRSALEIARETDKLGGNLNAYTSHEETAFMIKVVDEQIPAAFDLIADMLAEPVFDEKELRRERQVILEEIKMVEDTPEEFLSELFLKDFFPHHPLGLPIEGTRQTVRGFSGETAARFHRENYTPENLVIACAGNISHRKVAALAERYFASRNSRPEPQPEKMASDGPQISAPILLKRKKNLEQTHLIIAAPWISAIDKRRYAAALLTSILGDGNSSRLWQSIREKRGLAYSVGAAGDLFADCGVFSIYAGTSPEYLSEVIDLSIAELRQIKKRGVTAEELELAQDQMVASVLLGIESTAARAENLAHQEMTYGRQIPVREIIRQIRRVEAEEIRELAKEFFQTERIALAALGKLNGLRIGRERLDVS